VQTIKLGLEEIEAQEVFEVLKNAHKLHPAISDWRKAWAKVADKRLLIEYIYLLTHGEMLSERIAHQISQIGQSDNGKIKCEVLRKVCFADIWGIKLPAKKLIASLSGTSTSDYKGDVYTLTIQCGGKKETLDLRMIQDTNQYSLPIVSVYYLKQQGFIK